jgi:ribosomal protein L44E
MSRIIALSNPNVRAYLTRPFFEGKVYKEKQLDLKCQHCHNIGHIIDRY